MMYIKPDKVVQLIRRTGIEPGSIDEILIAIPVIQEKLMRFNEPMNLLLAIKQKLISAFAINAFAGENLVHSLLGNSAINPIIHNNETFSIDWDLILTEIWHKLSAEYFDITDKDNAIIRTALTSSHEAKSSFNLFIPSNNKLDLNCLSNSELTTYLTIIEHKNLSNKTKLTIIFNYLSNELSQDNINYFWNYAASQNASFANAFARRFIEENQSSWQNLQSTLFSELSSRDNLKGLMLKVSFLSDDKKINLMFNQTNDSHENGLRILAKSQAKSLSSLIPLISSKSAYKLLNDRIRITNLTTNVFFNAPYFYPNLLDSILLKDNLSANDLFAKFLTDKILPSLLVFLLPYFAQMCFSNQPITAHITAIGYYYAIAVSINNHHIMLKNELINTNLLPRLIDLIYNKDTLPLESATLLNLPLDLIQQEQAKSQGDIKLALSLVSFAIQTNWRVDKFDKTISNGLINKLAKELATYANSNKTEDNKHQLQRNWIAYCEESKLSATNFTDRCEISFALVAGLYSSICMFSPLLPYVLNSDQVTQTVAIWLVLALGMSLMLTSGQRLLFIPPSYKNQVDELEKNMESVISEDTRMALVN